MAGRQPSRQGSSPPADAQQLLEQALAAHQEPGNLLPVLHFIQDALGHIPDDLVPDIAHALQLSRAEVHGVITFYPHFRRSAPAKTVIAVCQAEACQSRGAAALYKHALERCHGNDAVHVEPVYCLGLCAQSPSVMVNEHPVAHVTPEKLDGLIASRHSNENTAAGADSRPKAEPLSRGPGVTFYVPRDTAAIAAGADQVASALLAEAARRDIPVTLVRNGSRGLLWLEPMVEVDTPKGRIAYGPVQAHHIPELFDAHWHTGAAHALCHGPTDAIPFLKNQERLTFARVGITDPLSLADYQSHGGLAGLTRALAMPAEAIVREVTDSGLRGRGGAAFPTGVKWKTVLDTEAPQKYIVCNADEGDSGTFSDRLLMEGDPYALLEGMAIAGLAVGATQGYIYVRSEYPLAIAALEQAIDNAIAAGWLGDNVLGSGRRFHIVVRKGAGAYICGEETSLLESLEGKRGLVRAKPPLPAVQGLFGKPTVVNNVISLATVPCILARGAAFYQGFGIGRSRGTLPFQLAGNLKQGGLVEKAFGVSLRQLLFDFGGGSASGKPIKAVQVGGPLGAYLPPEQWDEALDYERYIALSAMVGHGGIVAFDDSTDMSLMARYAMEFCSIESCGKCTPCRIGAVRGAEVIDKIRSNDNREQNVTLLRSLCDTMLAGSLCAMGGMTPYPVLSALNHFPQDFGLAAPSRAHDA